MIDPAHRGAYLQALGIEQWQPRALPIVEQPTPAEEAASEDVDGTAALRADVSAAEAPIAEALVNEQVVAEQIVEPTAAVAVTPGPEVVVVAPEVVSATVVVQPPAVNQLPLREQLTDRRIEVDLARASVTWASPPSAAAGLAVLGINAVGSELQPVGFDTDFAVLQKMLTAINVDIAQCAVGGLSWAAPGPALQIPYALILVDSGEDGAALIAQWPGELLQLQGAQAVIAPHPRMFAQGTALKRQAWNALQQLQKLWSS